MVPTRRINTRCLRKYCAGSRQYPKSFRPYGTRNGSGMMNNAWGSSGSNGNFASPAHISKLTSTPSTQSIIDNTPPYRRNFSCSNLVSRQRRFAVAVSKPRHFLPQKGCVVFLPSMQRKSIGKDSREYRGSRATMTGQRSREATPGTLQSQQHLHVDAAMRFEIVQTLVVYQRL
jgi:hypothetical protein